MKKTYTGGCHCGAIRFECQLDLASGTTRCNCQFCRKARFWMAFAKADEFRLLQGEDIISDYQQKSPSKPEPFLHFKFCSRCGIRPFTEGGELEQFGGAFYAVNLACLENATDAELAGAPIHFADGRNDDWTAACEATRYL